MVPKYQCQVAVWRARRSASGYSAKSSLVFLKSPTLISSLATFGESSTQSTRQRPAMASRPKLSMPVRATRAPSSIVISFRAVAPPNMSARSASVVIHQPVRLTFSRVLTL